MTRGDATPASMMAAMKMMSVESATKEMARDRLVGAAFKDAGVPATETGVAEMEKG